ncbi:MAG TPA: ACP S-malonyltransferase [Steroidobacteraceae bacterium]|jgi:[acyl-carrier-protein] S-malonyltransferase
MSLAFVFPGQGSQKVGMLAAFAAQDSIVRETFEEASGVLGYDLWKLVQEGPEEQLNATEKTQPAMLAAGVATLRLWRKRGGREPAFVSGHSLGEFTALVCAGSLDFTTAVDLVRFRGRVMQEAVPAGEGAMAAIVGLADEDVQAACTDAAQGQVVVPVNFNCPGQIVIAGQAAAVQRAIEAAKDRGAKMAKLLPLSVPSHCSLMEPAAKRLEEKLAGIEVRDPTLKYISAVDSVAHGNPADIRSLLVRQVVSPVRWTQTVRALIADGVDRIIECGPNKALTGMNKRIEKRDGLEYGALEDPASLAAALESQ